MRRLLAFLLCLLLLCSLGGCSLPPGYRMDTGIFVRTQTGQQILVFSGEEGDRYFLMTEDADCKSMANLNTGDKVTITTAALAYEDFPLAACTVYKWRKHWFGHTEVSQETLDKIETLVADYKAG